MPKSLTNPKFALVRLLLLSLVIVLIATQTSLPGRSVPALASPKADSSSENYTFLPLVLKNHPRLNDSQQRIGFVVSRNAITNYDTEPLNNGWYVTTPNLEPATPHGIEPVFLVLLRGHTPTTLTQYLAPYVRANPGRLWLIGNEPDRDTYQDGLLPTQYATLYHAAYQLLKQEDPSCQVAIGGVVQPTPLRLQYLDMIRSAYQTQYGTQMPVDVWNIHNQILREVRGEWGAEIPPGISADVGRLYDISDNDDIEIFERHIRAFRQWMAARGERNKPLIISEFGVLMPEAYGFDRNKVQLFMYQSFDFLLTATSDVYGYPDDNNRLVQRFAWYSLDDLKWTLDYQVGFNGNLFDSDTFDITGHGIDFIAYTSALGN